MGIFIHFNIFFKTPGTEILVDICIVIQYTVTQPCQNYHSLLSRISKTTIAQGILPLGKVHNLKLFCKENDENTIRRILKPT